MLTQTPRSHPILWFHCTVELHFTFYLWYFLSSRRKWPLLYTADRHKSLDTTSVDKQWKIGWSTRQSVFSVKNVCLNQLFLHYCCKLFPRFKWLEDRMTKSSSPDDLWHEGAILSMAQWWQRWGCGESHLCTHDESYEEGDHRHPQDQQLSTVSSPEGLRVHVHHSCHQTLHTHKLRKKRRLIKNSPHVLKMFFSVPFHHFYFF